MKSTGIVRRFDDLGRVVIPRELRQRVNYGNENMEGQAVEIFIEDGSIILKKYKEEDPVNKLIDQLREYIVESNNPDYNRAMQEAIGVIKREFHIG